MPGLSAPPGARKRRRSALAPLSSAEGIPPMSISACCADVANRASSRRPRCPPCNCNTRQRTNRRRQLLALTITLLSLTGRTRAFTTPIPRQRHNHNIRFALLKDETTARSESDKDTPNIDRIDVSRIKGPASDDSHNHNFERREVATERERKHNYLEEERDSSPSDTIENRSGSGIEIESGDRDESGEAPKEDASFNQFAVVNDLVSASERVLDNLDTTSATFATRNKSYSSLARLSKAHHSMMAQNVRRQRFVTGKYPLYVSVQQNPTKKWLGQAESQIYLNGTSIEKSLASYDAFHWLDDKERRELHGDYEFLSLELLAEIHVKKPGYVNILPKGGAGMSLAKPKGDDGVFGWKSWKMRDDLASRIDGEASAVDANGERLWVTGFSLAKPRGELHTMDVESGTISSVSDRTAKAIQWPNEVASIPSQSSGEIDLEDALLVTDGFLVPGKDRGGLYVVRNPGNDMSEWRVCLTGVTNLQDELIRTGEGDWFYHRAVWMDLTGDGRLSILAARAKLPLLKSNNGAHDGRVKGKGRGQLVWLERPMPHSFDAKTGTPLDVDGTVFDPFSARNTPWKLRVLDEGPDVMFSVADLDRSDDTVEVIASQFFGKKLSLHSLRVGPEPKIVFRRTIDERCGSAFSSILADLDGLASLGSSDAQPRVVDSGSTVLLLKEGDPFSHLLVTSHECSYAEGSGQTNANSDAVAVSVATFEDTQTKIDGGSLFGYRVPIGKGAWKTEPWLRSVIATGFKVEGQISNMINPGAPGFCYTFFPHRSDKKWHRPLIGLAGDCAESAYILRPIEEPSNGTNEGADRSTNYALMTEIKCGSTVGSLAIGYEDLYSAAQQSGYSQQSGYAKIYVPCYEEDKVLVFSMGSGEDEYMDSEEDDGW